MDIIIICGMYYHDKFWTSKQHIALRLAKRHRVLFVEPAPLVAAPLLFPLDYKNWTKWLMGLRKEKENLFLYAPPPLRIPADTRYLIVDKLNQKIISSFTAKAANRIGIKNPIVWSFDYRTSEFKGKLKESLFIYHCVDEWAEMPVPFLKKEIIGKIENRLAGNADIVFASARKLEERLSKINKNTFYIPHGVDYGHFSQDIDNGSFLPEDIKDIKGTVVGFSGTIENWVDIGLIEYIARQKQEWTLLFVGMIGHSADVSNLKKYKNIIFTGLKKREELPKYLKVMDVCIIPFKINRLTEGVNPLKLYEYLAAGKPVVSTPLLEVQRMGDMVKIADGYDAFIKAIEESMKENTTEDIEKRRSIARESSWDVKVREMENIIKRFL
ncbi:MAG: glycosyltransferase [Nitrospinae bacterium]|nr:glycosyltransferase [Nitrospinota bacterium]